MSHNTAFGFWGECFAADYLDRRDYCVFARNVRLTKYEIDLVACSPFDKYLVFVEVKTRAVELRYKVRDAVTREKMARIDIASRELLHSDPRLRTFRHVRYDIITIVGNPRDGARLTHYIHAFDPTRCRVEETEFVNPFRGRGRHIGPECLIPAAELPDWVPYYPPQPPPRGAQAIVNLWRKPKRGPGRLARSLWEMNEGVRESLDAGDGFAPDF